MGLIEIGQLKLVEDLLKKYRTSDNRHLFGIHLSCYFLSNLRIASSGTKDIARRISAKLTNKIRPLVFQMLNDLKSMLVEIRRDKLEILADTPPKELMAPSSEEKDSVTDDD